MGQPKGLGDGADCDNGYQRLNVIVIVALVFGAVSTWAVLDQQMARVLTTPRRLGVFNWTMAALLVASLYPVLWPS